VTTLALHWLPVAGLVWLFGFPVWEVWHYGYRYGLLDDEPWFAAKSRWYRWGTCLAGCAALGLVTLGYMLTNR